VAWIESHQELERHPKTLRLAMAMGWGLDETIGKVHRFWWWALQYAEDGDLRRFNDGELAMVVGLKPDQGKGFIEAMVMCGGGSVSGFIDREPYFKVHDWMDYAGRYLESKYRTANPRLWREIQRKNKAGFSPTKGRLKSDKITLPKITKPKNTVNGRSPPTSPEDRDQRGREEETDGLTDRIDYERIKPLKIADYAEIEACPDPIVAAISVTGGVEKKDWGYWTKVLNQSRKKYGPERAERLFRGCLRELWGEMRQGECRKPGAVLNVKLGKVMGI